MKTILKNLKALVRVSIDLTLKNLSNIRWLLLQAAFCQDSSLLYCLGLITINHLALKLIDTYIPKQRKTARHRARIVLKGVILLIRLLLMML